MTTKKKVYQIWAQDIFYGSFDTMALAVHEARQLYKANPKILYEIREGKV